MEDRPFFAPLLSFPNHISPVRRNGRAAPIFRDGGRLAEAHEKERQLQREISREVEAALPGVEVLAVELTSRERFTVFIDAPGGVDHALCERVTNVLRGYLDRYSIDVSSPGFERPLRKPAHFRNAVGRRVAVRTEHSVAGRKRFRGTVVAADDAALALAVSDSERVEVPYAEIVRGNLIDEGGPR
jgi:ribosome maturation factor RimP